MDGSSDSSHNKLLSFWQGLINNEEDFDTKTRTLRGQHTLQKELWQLYEHPGLSSTFGEVLTLINKQPDGLRGKLIELYRSVPLPREVQDSYSAAPAVLVLGMTQSGKTTLVNSIRKYSGDESPELLVGDGTLSKTTKTIVVEVAQFYLPKYISLPDSLEEFRKEDWKRPPQVPSQNRISGFKLVDAPGLGDSEGRDPRHILDLARAIRDAGSLSGVMLVVDSNSAFGKLKEGLDYYLRFLDSLHLPLFVVHTKWDSLTRTSEEKEKREEEFQQFLYDTAGKEFKCIHFFIDMCGWEDDFQKRPFTEHYEALKSNSLHRLCKHMNARSSYFTHEFMIEKVPLFKNSDSMLLQLIETYKKNVEEILHNLREKEEDVISKIYESDVKRFHVTEKYNSLYKELLRLDTDQVINFHTVEPNLGEDKIFCPAPGATSYKVVGMQDGVKLENIIVTKDGVSAEIVCTDPKASNKWGRQYFNMALIATGPFSTFYKDRIKFLKEKIEKLLTKSENLKKEKENYRTDFSKLAVETEQILLKSERVGWLSSVLSTQKLSIPEYAVFLSHYQELAANKKPVVMESFADSIFKKIQQISPLPSAVLTPGNPITKDGISMSASQLCEIWSAETVRGRFLGGPVTVSLATKETEMVTEHRALLKLLFDKDAIESTTLQHWCLLLKSERDPDNIYIMELDAASEGSQIVSRMGRLTEKGQDVYKNKILLNIGIFPDNISLELLYELVTVKHSFSNECTAYKALGDNCQRWVGEIIPLLEEAAMQKSSFEPPPMVCQLKLAAFGAPFHGPTEASEFFYLRIGSSHYLNFNEEGMACWDNMHEETPYFRKVGKEDEEWFYLEVMGPVKEFKNRFLTTGWMDYRLVLTSKDEAPSFGFAREKGTDAFRKDDCLYCLYFWFDRSPISQKHGDKYLYATDLTGGMDVAVLEVKVPEGKV